MRSIPPIESVRPLKGQRLFIRFQTGETRIYDCTQLLTIPRFHFLKDPAFFRMVRVDRGGYGLSWNDEIDVSDYEVWINGQPVSNNSNLD